MPVKPAPRLLETIQSAQFRPEDAVMERVRNQTSGPVVGLAL